jgi:hypothetical protein
MKLDGGGEGAPQAEGCRRNSEGGGGVGHCGLLAEPGTDEKPCRTQYEAWHGWKPAINHLRVFGCWAFVKELGHVNKLADRSRVGVFIGYVEGAKAYPVLDPTLCSTK